MPKRGRPVRKLTDEEWERIELLASAHAPMKEIASLIGVARDTLERRIRERHGVEHASEWAKTKRLAGKAELREARWKAALAGCRKSMAALERVVLREDHAPKRHDPVEHVHRVYHIPARRPIDDPAIQARDVTPAPRQIEAATP
ncbi:MAG: hypothetical protein OXO52_22285 [Rhodospirillales bacterium]|nr:hypothetical protein [Rhodospirillales bacterium]MDE0380749.1 hypothetical protein [Rhodospirillales bacterium]